MSGERRREEHSQVDSLAFVSAVISSIIYRISVIWPITWVIRRSSIFPCRSGRAPEIRCARGTCWYDESLSRPFFFCRRAPVVALFGCHVHLDEMFLPSRGLSVEDVYH